jgi:hypothetical protein
MLQGLVWLAAGGLLFRAWWLLPAWWLAFTQSRCAAALIREQAKGELQRLRHDGAQNSRRIQRATTPVRGAKGDPTK